MATHPKKAVTLLEKLRMPQAAVKRIRGATFTEYGMVVGLIALLSVGAIAFTGTRVSTVFCETAAQLEYRVNGADDGVPCLLGDIEMAYGGPDIVIPDTYQPVTDNMVLFYEGAKASFVLTGTEGVIDWGDGAQDTIANGTKTYSHTYAEEGTWKVVIDGSATSFKNTAYAELRNVKSFGTVGLTSLSEAFAQTADLRSLAALPDTVTNISGAFKGAAVVPQQIETWNVSAVTNAESLFEGALEFQPNIAYWDVSGMVNMKSMFRDATEFNADISAWNPASATSFEGLFAGAIAFDGDLREWDTSNVSSMRETFSGAASFDHPIGSWDVSNVTTFRSMFEGATAFNKPLNGWDVSSAIRVQYDTPTYSFYAMFKDATSFNQPLNKWDVSGVEDLYPRRYDPLATQNFASMFEGASSFEQSLLAWCVDVHEGAPANFSTGSLMINEPIWGACGVPNYDDGIHLAYRGGEEVSITLDGVASIDWGDGTYSSTGTNATATHVLPEGERVVVRIAGDTTLLQAPGAALLEVESFGNVPLISLASAFVDTDSLERLAPLPATVTSLNATFENSGGTLDGVEAWDTAGVRDMRATFKGAETFNQPIGGWDTASVLQFDSMFEGATSFDQPLNDWDVSGAYRRMTFATASFRWMFKDAVSFNQPLDQWDVSGVADEYYKQYWRGTLNFTGMFQGAASFEQSLADWCVDAHASQAANFSTGSKMINEPLWGSCGLPEFDDGIVLAYRGGEEVTIAATGSGVIDWGTGTYTKLGTHTTVLPEGDRVLVKLAGGVSSLQAKGDALLEVESFGAEPLTSLAAAFEDANNLEKLAPMPASVRNLNATFRNAGGTLEGVELWNTANVTSMIQTFAGATAFDRPIGTWDVSKVVSFKQMFDGALSFNQPLNDWVVTNIKKSYPEARSYYAMFRNAASFNQPLDQWDMTGVDDKYAYKNQDTNNLTEMFHGALSFEQSLADWCVNLYGSIPPDFSTDSAMISEPVWGSCGKPNFDDGIVLAYRGGESVTITTTGSGGIDWGDGSYSTRGTRTHTLPEGERVEVRLAGGVTSLQAQGDALLEVVSFGNEPITSLASAFEGTDNLEKLAAMPASVTNLKATFLNSGGALEGVEAWNTSGVVTMEQTFAGATGFDRPIGGWDVSAVKKFAQMFDGASEFNQPLNGWDVSNVTKNGRNVRSFFAMFRNATAFNQPLDQWDLAGVDDFHGYYNDASNNLLEMFSGASSFAQSLEAWCMDLHASVPVSFSTGSAMTQEPFWGQCGKPDFEDGIVLAYRGGEEVTVVASGGRAVIDWGDGTYHSNANGVSATHVLPEGDRVEVRIAGGARSIEANGDALLEVVSFGSEPLTSLASAFEDADNLERLAPLPATVTSLQDAFANADGALVGVESWNTSAVKNMRRTFQGASAFNRPIGNWDVSNVTSFEAMFDGASSFNQPLGEWDVSAGTRNGKNARTFYAMFRNATSFNQPLDAWDMQNVEDLQGYYADATNILTEMFHGASSFKQSLLDWCVNLHGTKPADFATGTQIVNEPLWGQCGTPDFSSAMVLEYMGGEEVTLITKGGKAIDWGDGKIDRIGGTNTETTHVLPAGERVEVRVVGGVTHFKAPGAALLAVATYGSEPINSLESTFQDTQNLEAVPALPAAVANISYAFKGAQGPLVGVENWDTSGVTNMRGVFMDTPDFNRDISGWDVSNVLYFTEMFSGASSFNRPLNGWDTTGIHAPTGSYINQKGPRTFQNMFKNAVSFNQPLDDWDVSMVRRAWCTTPAGCDVETTYNFDGMFDGAASFAQDLTAWCTSSYGSTPPQDFSTGSAILAEPVWGTCP